MVCQALLVFVGVCHFQSSLGGIFQKKSEEPSSFSRLSLLETPRKFFPLEIFSIKFSPVENFIVENKIKFFKFNIFRMSIVSRFMHFMVTYMFSWCTVLLNYAFPKKPGTTEGTTEEARETQEPEDPGADQVPTSRFFKYYIKL